MFYFGICATFAILDFNFKKIPNTFFYVCRTIRWYVTVEITFIWESIQGDEHTTATFRTSPEIMANFSAYDPFTNLKLTWLKLKTRPYIPLVTRCDRCQ